jgi:ubiquinone/menaquinone biosynthesis C-methylase UbiE
VGDDILPEPTPARLAAQARIEVQGPLDRQLAPLGRRALEALAPVVGERILDIGCGAGQTLLELADAVRPSGTVLGVDISAPLVEMANQRARNSAIATCVEGDVQRHPFEPEAFDAAFSRFGVMFFADPTAAFGNIRRALRPGGRLAFVCWRAFEENELDFLPLRTAAPHLPP